MDQSAIISRVLGESLRPIGDSMCQMACGLSPEPEVFDPNKDGKFTFAFLAYDGTHPYRIPCQASTKKDAKAEAKHWLKGTYWNDDDSSVVPEPVFWHTLVAPDGTKLGGFL